MTTPRPKDFFFRVRKHYPRKRLSQDDLVQLLKDIRFTIRNGGDMQEVLEQIDLAIEEAE